LERWRWSYEDENEDEDEDVDVDVDVSEQNGEEARLSRVYASGINGFIVITCFE